MTCERRVWRYEGCDHEEELDIKCGCGGNPHHIHNSILMETRNPPRCSICNPPALVAEEVASNLAHGATTRHLPAPGTINSLFRGTNAEALAGAQVWDGAGTSTSQQDGMGLNGTHVNGVLRHAGHQSLDLVRNVPARRMDGSTVQVQEEGERTSRRLETNGDTGSERRSRGGWIS
ncbi:MAG: hypothetical protein Q9219_007479 [cf. Caloplaca sp. 3 TL-2023]